MTPGEEFEQLRPLLFAIAYRILASVAEAEDAVQETWLRYESSPAQPASTKAFLSAVVTRISITCCAPATPGGRRTSGTGCPNHCSPTRTRIRSGRRSWRTRCRWRHCCCSSVSRRSSGRCSCCGRCSGFGFAEVAAAVGRSEPACRQLAVRARRHMDLGRTRFEADRRERAELAARFFDALRDGDIDRLREFLAADVQMLGDGGGKAPALPNSVTGADNVARVLASASVLAKIGASMEPRELNGQPGAILRDRRGNVLGTVTLDVLGGRIQTIRSVVNPDKLGHVGPVAQPSTFAREVKQARHPYD